MGLTHIEKLQAIQVYHVGPHRFYSQLGEYDPLVSHSAVFLTRVFELLKPDTKCICCVLCGSGL